LNTIFFGLPRELILCPAGTPKPGKKKWGWGKKGKKGGLEKEAGAPAKRGRGNVNSGGPRLKF